MTDDREQSPQSQQSPRSRAPDAAAAPRPPWAPGDAETRIAGILFADVVGFSKLSDVGVVQFFREFLGEVARLVDTTRHPPLVRNTWGDGLFFVFGGSRDPARNVRDAGLFALELCDLVGRTRWGERALPPGLGVRVALHAGPLFRFVDPVIRRRTLSGKHVTRAARIEPITPPGLVYASKEFAALAASQRVREFRCEPVGRVRLAKAAGIMTLFVVRPSTPGASGG